MVRAKFRCDSKKRVSWSKDVEIVEFNAVSARGVEENQRFHKYTPSGTITITIDNPPASEFFQLGKEYYLDFTEA